MMIDRRDVARDGERRDRATAGRRRPSVPRLLGKRLALADRASSGRPAGAAPSSCGGSRTRGGRRDRRATPCAPRADRRVGRPCVLLERGCDLASRRRPHPGHHPRREVAVHLGEEIDPLDLVMARFRGTRHGARPRDSRVGRHRLTAGRVCDSAMPEIASLICYIHYNNMTSSIAQCQEDEVAHDPDNRSAEPEARKERCGLRTVGACDRSADGQRAAVGRQFRPLPSDRGAGRDAVAISTMSR